MSIKIIGLTGQTGAGKSTVSQIFKTNKIHVIDCDKIAKEVSETNKFLISDIALKFGVYILLEDGSINRKAFSKLVFSDRKKLDALNEIIFPYIKEEVKKIIDFLEKKKVDAVVLDAPTLFESELDKDCDVVISVIAPEKIRQDRIMKRDSISNEEAINRMNSQLSEEYFKSHSSYVIVNEKDINSLRLQTLEILNEIFTEEEKIDG